MLRGGGGERIGLAAGDELIGAGGWRLRRLDDALRFAAPARARRRSASPATSACSSLRFEPALLAGDEAAPVQLRRADDADAEARRLCEAWISG